MPPLNQTSSSSTIYFHIDDGVVGGGGGGGGPQVDNNPGDDLPPYTHVSGTKDFSWMYPLLEQMREERTFDPTTEALLILAFVIFITFGAMGNGLVCFVVARNPHMRTPRNIFIINLAISDLTLCVFTQPLNLYLLIKTQWELGSFMCKFVTMFQGTNLFVSTISITAIALDRFQVIVYPTKESMKKAGAAIGLLSVWVISFFMASPALLFQVLDAYPPLKHEFPDFYLYNCIEDENMKVEKRAYTVAQMVVQYILPFIILTVAHLRICNKLRYRMVNQQQQQQALKSRAASQQRNSQEERRSRRKRKTNLLLSTIAVVFALSWLPLNIFNLLSEFHRELFHRDTSVDISLAYAICHLLVLCSACLNPVVYGWFNDNFKAEFLKILCSPRCAKFRTALQPKLLCRCCSCCCCCCRGGGGKDTPSVPSITLTKATNGEWGGGGGGAFVRPLLTTTQGPVDVVGVKIRGPSGFKPGTCNFPLPVDDEP
ncbi:putative neuropeptide Y receptor 11 [Babylonia areolata]|uniref:putative neuropeptide Y receptor 11 n=1 Tax=Babylonia areolata TaxID=304850 RepID=UPI003FCFACBD